MSELQKIEPFKFWSQKVLPTVYDDSLSYYEVLNNVVNKLNEVISLSNNTADNFTDIKNLFVKLSDYVNAEIDKIKDGGYSKYYLTMLQSYINANLQDFVARIVKFINFGLDDNGYFIAVIPSTWDFIKFDTNLDTESKDYGKLILNY